MASKWEAVSGSYDDLYVVRTRDNGFREDWTLHENFETLETAQELADALNELERYREERRWRKIGEEWPEDGTLCQMSTGGSPCPQNFPYYAAVELWGYRSIGVVQKNGDCFECGCTFTYWRPAPVDVPKEGG